MPLLIGFTIEGIDFGQSRIHRLRRHGKTHGHKLGSGGVHLDRLEPNEVEDERPPQDGGSGGRIAE